MFEQPKNNPENPEEKLINFRNEIEAIIKNEKETEETGHFSDIPEPNLEELTPEDFGFWEKVKDESITREDLAVYKRLASDPENKSMNETGKLISPTRYVFYNFVVNTAMPVIMDREMKILDDFRNNVEKMKEAEKQKQNTTHFSRVNPRELELADSVILGKLEDGSLTEEDFFEYRSRIFDIKTSELLPGVPPSRAYFSAFIANKAIPLFIKKESIQ